MRRTERGQGRKEERTKEGPAPVRSENSEISAVATHIKAVASGAQPNIIRKEQSRQSSSTTTGEQIACKNVSNVLYVVSK